jgi:hypothetical protein
LEETLERSPQVSNIHSVRIVEPGQEAKGLSSRPFFLVAGLLLLLIGTALRVYQLGNRSLWYDEAATANASRGTWKYALERTRQFTAPVVHPYILYLVEKVRCDAVAVRAPSLFASLLAVVVMLAMLRVKVSRNAALFAAAILAISSSQIRYAQEVREYSLTVLCATILIFCLLKWEVSASRDDHPLLLYAALFIAPLIQYGLVVFAVAILGTIVLRLLLTRDTSFSLPKALLSLAFLVAGAVLSFVLTVRYQFKPGGTQWYLAANYFDPKTTTLLQFLTANSKGLLGFSITGRVIDLCVLAAGIIFCVVQGISRKYNTITLLLFTSVSITMCASVARVYPYGGVRQCIFLAPVLALFAGVAFADLLQRLKGSLQTAATVALMAIIVISLYRGVLKEWPYREIEDTQSVLRELAKGMTPSDQVWVNHDAVEAFEFYQPIKDPRFIYGKFHSDARLYVPDLFGSIHPHSDRLWLVFSHLEQRSDRAEEQLIVESLRSEWDVHSVVAPTNTELYVADRKIASINDGGVHATTSPKPRSIVTTRLVSHGANPGPTL